VVSTIQLGGAEMNNGLIERCDQTILGACTRFSHWLQRLTGRTNFFIAKIGLGIATISILVEIANYFSKFLVHKTNLFDVAFGGLVVLALTVDVYLCNKAEEDTVTPERFMPMIRMGPLMDNLLVRVLAVTTSILVITLRLVNIWPEMKYPLLEVLYRLYGLGFTIFLYFIAVDPLPPGKSKVREWLEGFKFAFGLKPATIPVKD